ncbi:DUF5518 domain-containing protein [Halobaculum sp. EA56]|uniref:DUF5518 domain-containing protein n=1 Tax=Halobaculum sp. EA56 TaxID=3421648 RepID=UPI003EB6C94F
MASPSSLASGDSLKHALVGAVVSLVTFFLPFSPVLGGGVAGYLHGPHRGAGAKVGGLSGVFAAVPGAVLGTLIASVFVIAGPGQRSGILVAFAFFLVILAVTVVYGGILGAVGGFVGAFLNEEFAGPSETDSERPRDPTTLREGTGAGDGGDSDPEPELTEFDGPVDDPERD